ncbi:DUF3277 family protein [Methylobacterium sp. NMS14P]|uniref:phage protein n=1 Tax=Methylobacterium sp. NMS14P TaxID=2894310 RepID=UPI0023597EB3|nr:phage protein [Methylobacterium sp. NMS14P]WCS27234.1 DUF3277 family protein [Methylobacterium sp. NMS14P]
MTVAYSFADVNLILSGPGTADLILSESGVADEGITVVRTGDQNTMTGGATRGVIHSLHMTRSGRITLRLRKDSPYNRILNTLANYQFSSGAYHGQNILTVSNRVWGDEVDATQCAFVRYPDGTWAKAAALTEWMFDCGDIAQQLGDGTLVAA